MLEEERPPLIALLCDEPSTTRMAVTIHLERAGFTVAGPYERGVDLLEAADSEPQLIVFDLVQAGPLSTRFVTILRTAFPRTTLMVFVSLPTLRDAALAAGADEVFTDLDLRGFADKVTALASRLRSDGQDQPEPLVVVDEGTSVSFDDGASDR